jgi:hypothetical protein
MGRCVTANRSAREGGLTLWVLRNERGRFVECVVRLAPPGVKLEILSDGSRVITHRFTNGPEAVAWAEDVRQLWSHHFKPEL